MTRSMLSRRRFLEAGLTGALTLLSGCGTPLPLTAARPVSEPDAEQMLLDSAMAHGLDAYSRLTDINIRYTGQWRSLIDRIQPVVVDKAFRGTSEERLMPAAGVVAQSYRGTAGRKQVVWRRGRGTPDQPGEVAVWFNGRPSADTDVLTAAALVAEGYGLFLLGPLWLAKRGLVMTRGGTESVDGRVCNVVEVWMQPGLGRVELDRVAVCIERTSGLTRRVRFTLEGNAGTRGAVAQVDTFEHERRFGVMWPMRSYEAVVHPIRLPAHDWRIEGLDVNRGYEPASVAGPEFAGAAASPAAAL